MKKPLSIYLHDHLAGARSAIDLLKSLSDRPAEDPVGRLAAEILVEVEADRTLLRELTERIGAGHSAFKEAVALVGEKIGAYPLRHGSDKAFGAFLSLEALALGILGKHSLWQALDVVARSDERLGEVDFEALSERARSQHARVEELRLQLADSVLRGDRAMASNR